MVLLIEVGLLEHRAMGEGGQWIWWAKGTTSTEDVVSSKQG